MFVMGWKERLSAGYLCWGDGCRWGEFNDACFGAQTLGSFKRLGNFMDDDDKWEKAEVFIQGLPRIGLLASYNFPHFLMFLCSWLV